MALGIGYWRMMGLVVMPQALKLVIPGIVGSSIALFKDTTLVSIVGLFDFLSTIRSSTTDARWASPTTVDTGYLVAALTYFVFCFSMSRYSQFVERRLNTGHKR
jgi:general L-amino acid transport system permease protein